MIKIKKIIISLLLSMVFILNISAPLVYAYVNDKLLPQCDLFCNLSDANAKNEKQTPCPHHSQEAKSKRLNELFQCRISETPCHDTHTTTPAAPEVDPYILAAYLFNNDTMISPFNEEKLIISSQLYYLSIEKPPTALS
ncbi:MAG: hypothetical protein HZA06_03745 [Nitrospirae bacterium]|nr:hypothetical protein [Nitrospirota bacterium]